MTRTNKFNNRDHQAIAEGAPATRFIPKYFAKSGFVDTDPKKTKKNGGGKGNWGNTGEEVVDEHFNFTNARRRSNSSGYSNHLNDFKTKFDYNEQEPVFEESLHGPILDEEMDAELAKSETSESGRSSSLDGDRH